MKQILNTLNQQKKDKGGKFGVQVNIFGSKGSGKTFKSIKIMEECFKKPLVYYMSDDFTHLPVAIFKPHNYKEDLEAFLKQAVKMAKEKKIDALIFDEADLLFSANKPLGDTIKDLLDKHRHYFCSLVFISRRPQNLNSMIAEEGHFNIVFAIEGENVSKKLNGVRKGYGDLVKQLTYKSYDFVFKELGKEPVIIKP
jgi:DNA helicase HerA-like ATPase